MNIEPKQHIASIDHYTGVRENERYAISQFYEQDNPEGAILAQQIQGESYVAAGYVYPSALDELGRLQPELDRSRGDNVEYYIAAAKHPEMSPRNMGSLRVITIPEGGSLEDLAAYRYSKDILSDEVELLLQSLIAEHGRQGVKEICALAKTNEATSLVSFELLREITQAAIREKSEEKWLITFTSHAHDVFMRRYGASVMQQVGEPVPVDVGDERTSDELRLVPTLIDPGHLFENILHDIQTTRIVTEKIRLSNTLVFMADGLNETDLSVEVLEYIQRIKETKQQKAAA